MNKNTLIIVSVVVFIGLVGFVVPHMSSNFRVGGPTMHGDVVATIYKSPTCGCCGAYVSYIKKEGFDVVVKNIQDMEMIRQKFGIPYELESCHTMEMGEYVVEGHVPEMAIQKLLTEKPDIKGIGMAGMPSGSPGMPGPKSGSFVIYEITRDGTQGDVFMTI